MKVLICGLLHIPDGDAGAIRQHKLSVMLHKLNHQVLLVGLGKANGMQREIYECIEYMSLRQNGDQIINKVWSHFLYWPRLVAIMKEYDPQAVIADDLGLIRMALLKHYCRKCRIRFIHDSVEWYSPEQFQRGRMSLTYIRKNLLNRFLMDRNCRIIAISRYLKQHFQSKGCKCVRIPIVISDKDLCREKNLMEDKVVFTYAGQPGKKDYLHVMLEAFALLDEEMRERVLFNIVGCTKEQMIAAGIEQRVLEELEEQIVIHGRVSHDSVLNILKETDFTILIRSEEQRYAKAGFPTKVVESLSRSTPVICNLTSDLGKYLKDGYDSYIVSDCSAQSLKVQLAKALGMTYQKRCEMCRNACETAEKDFMYDKYLERMAEVLE